jgi:alpha-N-arabinofuranosidase
VRNFGDNRVFKIACGPNGADYKWTEVLMREVGQHMNGLALHYYCGTGKKSRSATVFDEDDWFYQLKNALHIEELVTKHSEIMDKYDPKQRVALLVDEWGAWHAVEPGTNPGFLYQQNSLRDALVAATTLNIFNNHCDRVKMANIAQMVNVLQAMILTDKEKMLLTPTYRVFEMYSAHQDAKRLPIDLQSGDYELGSEKIPAVNVSASRDEAGKIHVTLCNLSPSSAAEIDCDLEGAIVQNLSGRVLTAPLITSYNTFEKPEEVKTAAFDGLKKTPQGFIATLPAKSVVLLEVN